MNLQKSVKATAAGMAIVFMFAYAGAASALTASCTGAPSASSITWAGTSASGVAPEAYLWSNGATSSSQVVNVTPGTYTMNLQLTDASSTVATTTCSATVAAPLPAAPTITSFVASPTTITAGQSSVLSWVVANASTTSINNGVGAVTGSTTTVTPSVTTTYQLSAVNPGGTTNASVTVTVNATTTGGGNPTLNAQIQALLNQIAALKAQILQLVLTQGGGTGGTGTTTPATTTPATCFEFNRDFGRGHRGDDVRELQRMLASDPSIFPPGLISGFFGTQTEQALKKFQKKHGISSSSTGFFGSLSRKYYKEQCRDTDKDGVLNLTDTDDDNDGIIDTSDPHPLIPESQFNASSTSSRSGDDDDNGKGKGKGKSGKGNSNDD
jgi:Putative peptidoglycan binding domain